MFVDCTLGAVRHSSAALVNIISNPVNSTVPIASKVFKKAGTYDKKMLFAVTTLDVVTAKTFYAGKAKVPVSGVNVHVVGGHAVVTILPLFSQATPQENNLSEIVALTKRTQDGGTEVVEAKAGKGSAILPMVFFVLSKTNAKRASRVIQDTHNVWSLPFHPFRDFLLAGTDHHVPYLYDVNTFQSYLSANVQ